MSDLKQLSENRYWYGILALGAVVLIWVSSSFVMNSLFGDMNYNKPFLVTYLNTATFSFYLIPLLFKRTQPSSPQSEYSKLLNNDELEPEVNYSAILQSTNNNTTISSHHHKLSTYDTIKLSLAFCILWFLANYTTNASLAYTTVGSSTILASMSGKLPSIFF
ncbi:hypothetical protein BD770DRAFT_31038 [Pilaira anomala]|nr:hypothetical protein BD770DRAFT_31038 [Pilaira anomala]